MLYKTLNLGVTSHSSSLNWMLNDGDTGVDGDNKHRLTNCNGYSSCASKKRRTLLKSLSQRRVEDPVACSESRSAICPLRSVAVHVSGLQPAKAFADPRPEREKNTWSVLTPVHSLKRKFQNWHLISEYKIRPKASPREPRELVRVTSSRRSGSQPRLWNSTTNPNLNYFKYTQFNPLKANSPTKLSMIMT